MAGAGYAQAAGAGFEFISGLQQAEIIRQNGELSQMINEMNAEYAEYDAYQAELGGGEQVNRYENVLNQTAAEQKVMFNAQNIDAKFGTAADIQTDSKLNGILNKIDIQNQAHERALGYKNQARQYRMDAATGRAQTALNAGAVQAAAVAGAVKAGAKFAGGYNRKSKTGNNSTYESNITGQTEDF